MTSTILVVDDEPDLETLVQQKFRRQIRDGEVRFLFARDGAEALDVLGERGGVDMVVERHQYAEDGRADLLQKIQEATTSSRLSSSRAYGDMANIRTAMNRGAFDFLTKPIDFADLETTINKTLRHIEMLREARRRQIARSGRMHCCRAIFRQIWPSGWRVIPARCRSRRKTARDHVAVHRHGRFYLARGDTRDGSHRPAAQRLSRRDDRYRVYTRRNRREDHRRRAACTVRGAGRAAGPRIPRGRLRARARRRALDLFERWRGERIVARRDPSRPQCWSGYCRKFRRRALLRLHRLRRHGEYCRPARSCEQTARDSDLCRGERGNPCPRLSTAGRSATCFCAGAASLYAPSSRSLKTL